MTKNKSLRPLVRSDYNLLALGIFSAALLMGVMYLFVPGVHQELFGQPQEVIVVSPEVQEVTPANASEDMAPVNEPMDMSADEMEYDY